MTTADLEASRLLRFGRQRGMCWRALEEMERLGGQGTSLQVFLARHQTTRRELKELHRNWMVRVGKGRICYVRKHCKDPDKYRSCRFAMIQIVTILEHEELCPIDIDSCDIEMARFKKLFYPEESKEQERVESRIEDPNGTSPIEESAGITIIPVCVAQSTVPQKTIPALLFEQLKEHVRTKVHWAFEALEGITTLREPTHA